MNYKSFVAVILLSTFTQFTHAGPTRQVTAEHVISDYAKTKYPIVFAHGLFGFGAINFGDNNIDYYYQILPDLARNGGSVWMSSVSPMNSSEVRGEQMLQQVDRILALTGSSKVNLVGHSHGGQSVRYVAQLRPNNVASITTIASANQGAKLADSVLQHIENTPVELPVRTFFDRLVSPAIEYGGRNRNTFPHDSKAAIQSLSTAGSLDFNRRFPAGLPTTPCGEGPYEQNGIFNYSFMGNIAARIPNEPISLILAASSFFIDRGRDSDGVVARCDARFGRVIRDDYRWNHFNEINHVTGMIGIFSTDPVTVYRQHANRLKLQGL